MEVCLESREKLCRTYGGMLVAVDTKGSGARVSTANPLFEIRDQPDVQPGSAPHMSHLNCRSWYGSWLQWQPTTGSSRAIPHISHNKTVAVDSPSPQQGSSSKITAHSPCNGIGSSRMCSPMGAYAMRPVPRNF
jgi:hypothetical protein